jgi:hypothetical protein
MPHVDVFDNTEDLDRTPAPRRVLVATGWLLVAWFVLFILSIVQAIAHFVVLPDPVVSSFDGASQPDGTAPKGNFIMTYIVAVQALPNLVLFALALVALRGDVLKRLGLCIPNHWFWAHSTPGATIRGDKRIARAITWIGCAHTRAWGCICVCLFVCLSLLEMLQRRKTKKLTFFFFFFFTPIQT